MLQPEKGDQKNKKQHRARVGPICEGVASTLLSKNKLREFKKLLFRNLKCENANDNLVDDHTLEVIQASEDQELLIQLGTLTG